MFSPSYRRYRYTDTWHSPWKDYVMSSKLLITMANRTVASALGMTSDVALWLLLAHAH